MCSRRPELSRRVVRAGILPVLAASLVVPLTMAQAPRRGPGPPGRPGRLITLPGPEATLAELTRARYALARQLYNETLERLDNPAPTAGEGHWLVGVYDRLHHWADHAEKAIQDSGGPTDAHRAFLQAHADRMVGVHTRMRRLVDRGSPGFSQVDMGTIALLSLEARSWVLRAEEGSGTLVTTQPGEPSPRREP